MIREVDLLSQLPVFIQEFKEISQIMSAENPEFQTAEDETEAIKDNQFIATADETGLETFENLLNLYPEKEDTLAARRLACLAKWNNQLPYTMRSLVQKLDALIGEGSYTLELDNDAYRLVFHVTSESAEHVAALDAVIQEYIPCNLEYVGNNEYAVSVPGYRYLAAAVVTTKYITIN